MKRFSKKREPKKQSNHDSNNTRKLSSSSIMIGLSLITVIGAIAALSTFFFTDISKNIAAARANQVHAERLANTPVSQDVDIAEMPKNDEVFDFEFETSPGVKVRVNKEDILEHLTELGDAKFDDFLKSVLDASGVRKLESDNSNNNTGKSLEDAYIEAESKYPGRISASKRLSLIDELNAIDYNYYIAEKGDTLMELSATFGVSLGQLVEVNGIHDADVIPAGMIILVPLESYE